MSSSVTVPETDPQKGQLRIDVGRVNTEVHSDGVAEAGARRLVVIHFRRIDPINTIGEVHRVVPAGQTREEEAAQSVCEFEVEIGAGYADADVLERGACFLVRDVAGDRPSDTLLQIEHHAALLCIEPSYLELIGGAGRRREYDPSITAAKIIVAFKEVANSRQRSWRFRVHRQDRVKAASEGVGG